MGPTAMFSKRTTVLGGWVAVMRHRRNDRGMRRAGWRTRCIRAGEIHEFILCVPGDDPEQPMDDVSYLGFAEISKGGVVAVGDELWTGDRLVGTVHGFDETHFPNHYNILIATDHLVTGEELGLGLDEEVAVRPR